MMLIYWVKTQNTNKEVGLEVNADKTKYMFMFHYLSEGQI
jgi:hypothetical protein